MINITEIKNRIQYLNTESVYMSSPNIIRSYDNTIKTDPVNMNFLKPLIEGWEMFANDQQTSFDKLIELFEAVCERNSLGDINYVASFIIEKAVPKSRNAIETQTLVKRRLGRLKTKLATKINNKIDNVSNAAAASINQLKASYSDKTVKATASKSKEEKKAEVVEEVCNNIENKIEFMIHYDRIVENYEKLSKRFNIDKVIYENKTDLPDMVNEVCIAVDTYNTPIRYKFNVVYETCLYGLAKQFIPYTNKEILEYTSDYFISKEGYNKLEIKDIVDNSLFIDKDDTIGLEYITEYPEEEITESESGYGVTLSDILNENKIKDSETAKQIFNAFKEVKDKSVTAFKAVIRKIYTKSPEQIIEELPNILSWLRIGFIGVGSFALNPVLGIVVFTADQFIQLHLSRKETEKAIDKYKAEKKKAEAKLSKLKTDDSKKRHEKYIDSLDKSITKLEDYNKTLKTEKENEEADSFDDDFSFDESTLDIMKSIVYISENVDVLSSKSNRFYKLSTVINKLSEDNIDNISSIVNTIGSVIEKYEYKHVLEDARTELRKLNTNDKYYKIDCINSNLYKMNNDILTIEEDTDIIDIANHISSIKEAYDSINTLIDIYSSNSIIEGSVENSIKLVGEKIKKATTKVKDIDRSVSKRIDDTAYRISSSVERAFTNDNREAIIKGSLLPSTSKLIKLSLGAGIAFTAAPVLASISALGYLGNSKKLRAKERQLILDEIEIELKMVEKHLRLAEENNDLKAEKELLKLQRALEREHQRIKYTIGFKKDKEKE